MDLNDRADDGQLDELPDVTESRRVPASVFRITGTRHDGGGPDHGGAAVFTLDTAVVLHLVQNVTHTAVRTFGGTVRSVPEIDGCRGGIVLPDGAARVPAGLAWMCRRMRRQGRVTLEAWAELGPGLWWYVMVPSWRDDPAVDGGALGAVADHEVWAGGRIERASSLGWGRALPVPCGPDGTRAAVTRRTWYLVGVTDVPPPGHRQ